MYRAIRSFSAAALSVAVLTTLLVGCAKSDSTSGDGSQDTQTSETDSVMEMVGTMTPDTATALTDTSNIMMDSTMTNESANFYEISTRYGDMVIRLYDETPLHRDNFRKLVEEGYYDGTTFHRVIEGFMIQGGDGNSKDDDPYNDGQGGPGYTVDAEFNPVLFHKKGALAAARQADQVNPQRRSSGSQFYIVHGTKLSTEELGQMVTQLQQRDPSFSVSPEAAKAYTESGGTPFLDGQYTVFGEVVEGFDVLDAIAASETPRKLGQQGGALVDRPAEEVKMTIRPLPEYAAQ